MADQSMERENEGTPPSVTCKLCGGTGIYKPAGTDGARTCQCQLGQLKRAEIMDRHERQEE